MRKLLNAVKFYPYFKCLNIVGRPLDKTPRLEFAFACCRETAAPRPAHMINAAPLTPGPSPSKSRHLRSGVRLLATRWQARVSLCSLEAPTPPHRLQPQP